MFDSRGEAKGGTKRRFSPARIIQIVLGVTGITLFVLLIRDIDFDTLPASSLDSLPQLILTMLALLAVNYTCDTASWWLVSGPKRPSIGRLMSIRARCEAITNLIPGGAVIGEPYKIGLLRNASGMSRAEATTSFLLSKFVLIIGQTLYIFLGLALSYGVINRVSRAEFGVGNFGAFVLVGALFILLFVLTLAVAMVRFQPVNNRLRLTEKESRRHRWWNIAVTELREIEIVLAREFRRQRFRIPVAIVLSFIAWSLNGIELYVIARWLGVDATLPEIYAIDAVSVVVRMVVFVIPIGMGGQDWTIAGLAAAHGLDNPRITAGRMVVMKRVREFAVVAVGLVLLLTMRERVGGEGREQGTGNGE